MRFAGKDCKKGSLIAHTALYMFPYFWNLSTAVIGLAKGDGPGCFLAPMASSSSSIEKPSGSSRAFLSAILLVNGKPLEVFIWCLNRLSRSHRCLHDVQLKGFPSGATHPCLANIFAPCFKYPFAYLARTPGFFISRDIEPLVCLATASGLFRLTIFTVV